MTEKDRFDRIATDQKRSEPEMTKKQQIQAAKDRLLGELIGLSKAICGNIDEERFAPDEVTHQVMLESLVTVAGATGSGSLSGKGCSRLSREAECGEPGTEEEGNRVEYMAGLSAKIISEKWQRVPACEHCAHPCGRVAAYDLAEMKEDEPAVRSLKGEILANVKKAAGPALSAWTNGVRDEAVCMEFYQALYAVGLFVFPEKLKAALQRSETLLKRSRELEAYGIRKAENERFMREALLEAKKAEELHEVPIGCVIVRDGKIIGRGHNRRTTDKNVLAHAEIMAIGEACDALHDWRLEDCTLYVTLEPCPMCAGAMVQSRLTRCVIGSMSDKSGCAGSVINLLQQEGFNHRVEIESGVLREECAEVLSGFFERMRKGMQW